MLEDSRARLIAYLCQAGLSTARANSVLDDYAHNLAERQRALADANDELDHNHHVYGFSPAIRQVANLIDPRARANEPSPAAEGTQQPDDPRTICVCGHTRGEHITVGGPFGRGRLLCDSCDAVLACEEFKAS